MATLELENESLRSYVDKLMGQLLQARMNEPAGAAAKPSPRRSRSPRPSAGESLRKSDAEFPGGLGASMFVP